MSDKVKCLVLLFALINNGRTTNILQFGYICIMKKQKIELSYEIYRIDELPTEDRLLAMAAKEATRRSYAPYSRFHVGAAVLLDNGVTVTGTNQENVAYPSGLCAERTALYSANSQYPDAAVKAMAIATADAETVISPCGACRQVMIETEKRYGKPMRILLCGDEEVYVLESAVSLLPLAFI